MKAFVSRVLYTARVIVGLFGVEPRQCPACKFVGRFRAHGIPPRFDAECPRCHSLERHRLFVLADERQHLIREGTDVLHVAPEAIIGTWVRARCKRYVTLDLHHEADVRAKLEETALPAASFDHVVCFHVLEHVDDRRALCEIFRILRPGGTLLVMVPIVEGWASTYEDPDLVSLRERRLHFGQGDHVRYYGRDLRVRLGAAGFTLTEVTATGRDVVDYALLRGEKLFVAEKPR